MEKVGDIFEMQVANESLKWILDKKLGYLPLNAENNLIFTNGLITAYVLIDYILV